MTGPKLIDPYGAPKGADPRGALQSITLDLDRTEGESVNRMKSTHLEPFPDPVSYTHLTLPTNREV